MQSIKHTVFFKHSPQDVWAYLTEPDLIAGWLMKSNFEATVGHQFQFITTPLPNYNFDGIINCEVLEVVPYERLVYSWKGGSNGAISLDSVVEWTLVPLDGGTELQLEHKGFESQEVTMYMVMSEGWLRNMNRIGDLIEAKRI